jgi:hypothetical protein
VSFSCLQRRSYWLLGVAKGQPTYVLVHYLEAEGKGGRRRSKASAPCAAVAKRPGTSLDPLRPKRAARGGGGEAAAPAEAAGTAVAVGAVAAAAPMPQATVPPMLAAAGAAAAAAAALVPAAGEESVLVAADEMYLTPVPGQMRSAWDRLGPASPTDFWDLPTFLEGGSGTGAPSTSEYALEPLEGVVRCARRLNLHCPCARVIEGDPGRPPLLCSPHSPPPLICSVCRTPRPWPTAGASACPHFQSDDAPPGAARSHQDIGT